MAESFVLAKATGLSLPLLSSCVMQHPTAYSLLSTYTKNSLVEFIIRNGFSVAAHNASFNFTNAYSCSLPHGTRVGMFLHVKSEIGLDISENDPI